MKITYKDKVTFEEKPNIPNINKCRAEDLNEIKNSVNTNDDILNNLLNSTTIKKIWENSAPTSNFGPQSINIPELKEGQLLMIYFKVFAADDNVATRIIQAKNGTKGNLSANFWYNNAFFSESRNFMIDTTNKNITFYDGYGHSFSSNTSTRFNDWTIPLAIYAIDLTIE